jgi:hypothetical protein
MQIALACGAHTRLMQQATDFESHDQARRLISTTRFSL